jgi:hypothetical protein
MAPSGIEATTLRPNKQCHRVLLFTRLSAKIENRMGGACSTYREERGMYRVLVGKPEGKRPLERPRRRWEDNIMMDLREVGCGGIEFIGLAQDGDKWQAIVNAVMNLWVQ